MIVYAVVYGSDSSFFYNFEIDDYTMDLDGECLLPTVEIAQELICERIGVHNKIAKVTIHQITKNGSKEYSVEIL
ncbi:hypothetical protein [Paenibacillus taiwanensis]|uniref:hypothetical protein n=1 Tax=Paenibacillus taiwanensis TaxID=401638 RepID=UPI0004918EF4|nr:hypothetical protein [Paenibacillus taiwanensis]